MLHCSGGAWVRIAVTTSSPKWRVALTDFVANQHKKVRLASLTVLSYLPRHKLEFGLHHKSRMTFENANTIRRLVACAGGIALSVLEVCHFAMVDVGFLAQLHSGHYGRL